MKDQDGNTIAIGSVVVGAANDHPLYNRPARVIAIHGHVCVVDRKDRYKWTTPGGQKNYDYTAPPTFLGSLLRVVK